MLKEYYDKIRAEWKKKIIENAKRKEKFKATREVSFVLANLFI